MPSSGLFGRTSTPVKSSADLSFSASTSSVFSLGVSPKPVFGRLSRLDDDRSVGSQDVHDEDDDDEATMADLEDADTQDSKERTNVIERYEYACGRVLPALQIDDQNMRTALAVHVHEFYDRVKMLFRSNATKTNGELLVSHVFVSLSVCLS